MGHCTEAKPYEYIRVCCRPELPCSTPRCVPGCVPSRTDPTLMDSIVVTGNIVTLADDTRLLVGGHFRRDARNER